jgi:hypothetical protein
MGTATRAPVSGNPIAAEAGKLSATRVLRVEALLSKVDKKLLVRFIAGGKALHIVFCDRIPVGANLEVHP